MVPLLVRRRRGSSSGTQAGEGLTVGGFFVWDLDRTYTDELRCTSADAVEVIDHGPEVPVTYECVRSDR